MASFLPSFMHEPDSPQPKRGESWFPHVIDQRPDGFGNVLVTFAMPGLTRAVVRVPLASWLEGLHFGIPHALLALMFPTFQPEAEPGANGEDNDNVRR